MRAREKLFPSRKNDRVERKKNGLLINKKKEKLCWCLLRDGKTERSARRFDRLREEKKKKKEKK